MRQFSLRFGVSDGLGRRATTWKLWTETARGESDVYLTCRSLGGSMKISMHHSGQWHHAYTTRMFKERVDGVIAAQRDRFLDRWTRPAPIAPGVTLAIRILTPSLAVTTPCEPTKSEIVWLPNAPEGRATEIDIIYTAPTTDVSDWPGRRGMSTLLVGAIKLAGGETVWAVSRVVDNLPASKLPPKATGQFYRGMSRADIVEGYARALAFGFEPDGSMLIGDFAMVQGERN